MSCFHGSKIAGSQQSFLTETACALLSDGRKVWATSLFLSAIMHKFVHVNFFFAIFAGPWFVEIQKFCYHGVVV